MIAAANDNAWLMRALASSPVPSPRIVIAGIPRSGKSTLAAQLSAEHGLALKRSDDLIGMYDWSGVSAKIARGFDEWSTPWVCEGVALGRAIRKHLAAHAEGLPADHFVWLGTARMELSKGQRAMAAGCLTVWNEILPELRRRGAQIYTDTEGGPL